MLAAIIVAVEAEAILDMSAAYTVIINLSFRILFQKPTEQSCTKRGK